jgi:AraC-like DNA-binding protein/CheY-like chemotaxis protein
MSTMVRRAKPLLLWFEFASTPEDRDLRVATARFFQVAYAERPDQALRDVARVQPSALCFEFDHPDEAGLQALQDVTRTYPRLPVLMLTVDHSEALAVWAFRIGVLNYLVKPVAIEEFSRNLETVAKVIRRGSPAHDLNLPEVRMPRDLPTTLVDVRVTRLHPALEYVRLHFGDKITEAEAARLCGMRRFAFSRNFHAAFGITFREYVLRARIGEARRLLVEGGHPVTEVAFATGFNDGSYFARIFKRYTGVLPSQYRSVALTSIPAP